MQIYLFIGIGGAIGSCLRFLVSSLSADQLGTGFPYGTILVNLLGSFLLGWFSTSIFFKRIDPKYTAAVNTGLIGSFTTLSTLSVEFTTLFYRGSFLAAASYIGFSVVGGLIMAYLGLLLGMQKKEGEQSW